MKKILAFAFLIFSVGAVNAQNFGLINKILDKLENNNKSQKDYDDYKLEGKKFFVLVDAPDHSERHIIEFLPDNKVQVIELIDDKKTGDSFSNIFNGDIMRKHNSISVRADILEGVKIPVPKVYNLLLNFYRGYWYLIDVNTGEKWLETNYLK
ncbi:hypothetical protein SAMN05421847_0571 [Halpernia humi]|uniref:Uncharacterized protein n=1 Tax=Halpernia humi TaxID=493375 RepID=A0A1H5TVM7_9FLAO|nr:hypothetical protein [Halpernia humi]SEF66258.1 hypothetical protein SAMN05421847_0571 [Halpernia humi]